MEYLFSVLTLVAMYGAAAVALNLAFGLGGIFVVTQAAFLGVGAYTTAIMAKHVPYGFWPGLVLSALLAGVLAWLIAKATIQIKGDAFIAASIGLQVVLVDVFFNWESVTGGAFGLRRLPEITSSKFLFFLLALGLLSSFIFYARCISLSPIGRVLRAVRDDEVAARLIGKDAIRVKIQVYMVTSAMAAIAGGLVGIFTRYVHPQSFSIHGSILLISMIIVGGLGSNGGALLGAALVVGLPEVLRFLPVASTHIMEIQQLIYGSALILIPFLRPLGLLPDNYAQRNAKIVMLADIEADLTEGGRIV